jgi:GalNAc-alpha-(1->4)-GalNAc-alpha-(1->3)-diNAcBac-PP-undecaprenol alpha-1,4-N-acetyl-D-galactosaminyltransferase
VLAFTSGIIVQTKDAKKILQKSRYRFCRFKVIPNPIELPSQTPELETRSKVVINVGFIGRQKNQVALLRTFSTSDVNKEWELHFVGDGPDRRHLVAATEKLGMSDRVRFLGERRDVPELLQRSQVFAFTSLSEGFPNALAEALAHGCACISYDCPTGPSDLIRNGVNGLLIPVGDERLFAEQLRYLLSDSDLRLTLGMEAKRSMQKFASARILRHFEDLVTIEEI